MGVRVTNIKDDFYNEDIGKPIRIATGLQTISTNISKDYNERVNFAQGGVLTVRVVENV